MNVCCIIIRLITKKKNTLSYQGEKEKERKTYFEPDNSPDLICCHILLFHNTHKSFGTI